MDVQELTREVQPRKSMTCAPCWVTSLGLGTGQQQAGGNLETFILYFLIGIFALTGFGAEANPSTDLAIRLANHYSTRSGGLWLSDEFRSINDKLMTNLTLPGKALGSIPAGSL